MTNTNRLSAKSQYITMVLTTCTRRQMFSALRAGGIRLQGAEHLTMEQIAESLWIHFGAVAHARTNRRTL